MMKKRKLLQTTAFIFALLTVCSTAGKTPVSSGSMMYASAEETADVEMPVSADEETTENQEQEETVSEEITVSEEEISAEESPTEESPAEEEILIQEEAEAVPEEELPQEEAEQNTGFSLQEVTEQDGVITLNDGQEWYKVTEFEVGQEYLLVVSQPDGTKGMITFRDGDNLCFAWKHFSSPDPKTSAPYLGLSCGEYELVCSDGQLESDDSLFPRGAKLWIHDGSLLICAVNGQGNFLKYEENSEQPFSFTQNPREAANIAIYTNGDKLAHCITGQPHAESYVLENSDYSAPTFTVSTSDIAIDNIHWYTDGEEQPCSENSFTAENLTGLPCGVHYVTCLIEGHDETGIHYREVTEPASFVIAKGVIPDSVMTFSDIHAQYGNIGKAIERIMQQNDGCIPSLVVFAGDLATSGKQVDAETTLADSYPKMIAALGGLDAVFVAGNHEEASAASNIDMQTGLSSDLSPNGGIIFDSSSDNVKANGKNSLNMENLIVYGLNFDAVATDTEDVYTYGNVLADMEKFLQETAENYHGELVVISAHSGLHVLGVQPESVNAAGESVDEWAGDNLYNVDMSYELAELINRYAEEYNMDILYLFGHNHSKTETEMFLKEGDTLYSTKSFADKSFGEQTLHFTYAHAGYLSIGRGSSDGNFAVIKRDSNKYVYQLINIKTGNMNSFEIETKYQQDYASLERFAEMAKIDYEKKKGIAVYPEVSAENDIVTILLKDADGNLLETYKLNAKTGIGTDSGNAEINLPQTGNNSCGTAVLAGCAALSVIGGAYLVICSCRKKAESNQ